MKTFLLSLLICSAACTHSQNKTAAPNATNNTVVAAGDTSIQTYIVDAGCGECQMGFSPNGCVMAVRINGHAYLTEGTGSLSNYTHDHGNAHAKDGMCRTTRKAEVKGTIVNNTFKMTSFKLLDGKDSKPKPASGN